ncbi:MAG: hypothetical protein M1816_004178 [Peltula sp. TS41687]|nr:MAG: hypothetical protein M1816_004178 [Peltula sp. TS41687]
MIRLGPSRIDLSSKDLEESYGRLQVRRAAHDNGGLGKAGRRVNKSHLRNAQGQNDNGDPLLRYQGHVANTTGNSSESRDIPTFAATVRSLLQGNNNTAQTSSSRLVYSPANEFVPSGHVVHPERITEAGNIPRDLSGVQISLEEYRRGQPNDDDPPCPPFYDSLPFLSPSPPMEEEHPGQRPFSNDHLGQREEDIQRSFFDEASEETPISPEREVREVSRRFAEGLNLDGSPGDLHTGSYFNGSSSPGSRTDSSASTTVEGNHHSALRQPSSSSEGYQEPRRLRLPPSRLFISHSVLSSSPDKETLIRGPQNGARDEQRNMATRLFDRVRRYRQRTSGSHSFASSEPDSNGTYEPSRSQSQVTQLPYRGAMSTEPPTSSPPIPEGPEVHDPSEDLQPLTRYPRNVSFTPIRDPSLLSFPDYFPPPTTPTPRSRRRRYRSRSPRAHSTSPSSRQHSHPHPLSSSPPNQQQHSIPTTGSYTVYNDSLPASVQPQTPSARYTRPFNPAHTAPAVTAGGRLTQIFRRSRRQGRSGSLGRAGDHRDEENVSAWVEVDRWERRIRASIERRRRRWRSSSSGGWFGRGRVGRGERMDVDGEEEEEEEREEVVEREEERYRFGNVNRIRVGDAIGDADALNSTPDREVGFGAVVNR